MAKKKTTRKKADKKTAGRKAARKSVRKGVEKTMTYRPPYGSPIPNPPRDFLEDVVLRESGDYWRAGSGDSEISVVKHKGKVIETVSDEPALSFFLVEPHGFFFTLFEPDSESGVSQLVPFTCGSSRPWVQHYVGGLEMYIPRACFVSRSIAWEIVQEFCRTKNRSNAVAWVNRFSLVFPDPEENPPTKKDLV